jgi:uncharacterized membrane protein YraQ (UPF0718 family)
MAALESCCPHDPVTDWITFTLLGFDQNSRLGEAVRFFVADVPKVLLLLVLVVFVVGVIRSFFTPERSRQLLSGPNDLCGNIQAAALGIVTPFCSCSAVPLFIGFVTMGVPLGATFSFLIAAPLINEVAVVLLFWIFGWKIAGLYALTGLIIAIAAGWIIGRLKLEAWVEPWVYQMQAALAATEPPVDWPGRWRQGWKAVKEIVGNVWLYVVLGIALGAAVHGYVPDNALAAVMGRQAWWSVPAAVLLGVPMYVSPAGIIPVMQALLGKGAALGTVLAFMMAVVGLSLPEALILRKVLKLRLLLLFFGIVASGIMAVGYLFNAFW